MSIAFQISRRQSDAVECEFETDLDRARRLARLMDSEFEILGFRFGVDALVGLIPAVGDAVGLLAGLYPIHLVRKHGLGKWVERRMIANLVIDFAIGAIPLAGDLFDAVYKANLKNLALLEKAAQRRSVIT